MREMVLLDFRLPVAMRDEVWSIAPTESFASRVKALGITPGGLGEEVLCLDASGKNKAATSRLPRGGGPLIGVALPEHRSMPRRGVGRRSKKIGKPLPAKLDDNIQMR
jgi:hypothetical protein